MEKKIGEHGILANLAKTPYGAVYLLRARGGRKLLCHQLLLQKVRPRELAALQPLVAASLQLRHENVLGCLELLKSPKAWNLVYEFFSEQTLADFLEQRALDWDARVRIVRQLREVLKYADAKRQPHGHFRLRNFLVDARSGAVKALDPAVAALQTLYARAEDIEEFKYCAPEELAGAAPDARGDVWSLALVVWQVALGPAAFPLPTADRAVFLAALARPLEPPATPSAPLNELLGRALRADPQARPSREEFYLHAFFTGRARSPSPPGTPRRFSTRSQDRAPFFLQSVQRSAQRRDSARAAGVPSAAYYQDRVFELEVVARAVRAGLALITHNWHRRFLQYYRGLTLVVLNKALLHADNLLRSLKERINHYALADFERFLAAREEPRLVALAAQEAHRALKDLDDEVFVQLAQTCVSKNYADEVRAKIVRHLADEEEYRAFAKDTHAHVRKEYKAAVEERQVVAVRHALHLYEFILAGRIMENLEEF